MIPYSLLALLAAVLLGEFAAKRWLRQRGDDSQPPAGRILFAGVLAARLVFVAQHADDYQSAPWSILDMHQDAPTLPKVALRTLARQPAALDAYAGKPLVVNLWASWCPPCRREMPVFQRWQAQRPDVNFVFVNQGESLATVEAFLAQEGLTLRNVLLDETSQTGQAIDQRALPATLFFDANGNWTETRMGELSNATLGQKLERIASPR